MGELLDVIQEASDEVLEMLDEEKSRAGTPEK